MINIMLRMKIMMVMVKLMLIVVMLMVTVMMVIVKQQPTNYHEKLSMLKLNTSEQKLNFNAQRPQAA